MKSNEMRTKPALNNEKRMNDMKMNPWNDDNGYIYDRYKTNKTTISLHTLALVLQVTNTYNTK